MNMRTNKWGKKILIILLTLAVIGMYTFGDAASLFAADGSSYNITFNKGDKSKGSYTVTADFVVVKQASGNAILWTREAVDQDLQSQLESKAVSGDPSLTNGGKEVKWMYYSGYGKFTPGLQSWGTYEFINNGSGSVTVNVYADANATETTSDKVSHIDWGKYSKVTYGKITLTKKVENGDGLNGTFYFKLLNSSNVQVGDLKSIEIKDGVVQNTVTWTDLEPGDYTIIETDAKGTALVKGDKSFGRELVEISNDNTTKVTLTATESATDNTKAQDVDFSNITWTNGSASNLFGSASSTNLLAFGNVSNIIDIEGNVAVAGNFTSNRGFSAGSGNGGNSRSYSNAIALLVNGNVSATQINTKGHVVVQGTYSLASVGGSDYSVGTKYNAAELKALYGNAAEIQGHTTSYLVRSDSQAVRIKSNQDISSYFSKAKSYMEGLQKTLAALSANGTVTKGNDGTIVLKGTNSDLNVFNVNAATYDLSGGITLDCPSTSAVIVNISGKASLTSGEVAWGKQSLRTNTIFNFVDASTFTMNGSTAIYGSVLAPDMNFNVNGKNGNINGNAILNNLSNTSSGFECHEYYFAMHLTAEAKAEITNTFKEDETSVQFGITKEIEGREFKAGDKFTFDLYEGTDTSKTPIQSIHTNATSGTSQDVNFDAIKYKKTGTYTYTIKERIPSEKASGMTYSDKEYTVVVTVDKDSKGKLQSSYIIKDGDTNVDAATFTNKYVRDAAGSISLTATKTLSGRTLTADEFSFGLYDSDGKLIETKKNAADGSIAFTAFNYKLSDLGGAKTKTYHYTIKEIASLTGIAANGIKYDSTVYNADVTVVDDGDETLEVSVDYTKADGTAIDGAPNFVNTYDANGTATFSFKKELTGASLTANEFEFAIVQIDSQGNEVEGTSSTVKNDASGNVSFTKDYKLSDAGKTFKYKVTEVNSGKAGFAYDTKEYFVTVVVSADSGTGNLTTAVSYANKDGNAVTDPTFSNTYTAEGSASIQVNKELTGKELTAGAFSFRLVRVEGNSEVTGTEQTVTNKATGAVDFNTIHYTLADAGKTYTYKITEVVPGDAVNGVKNFVTYDQNPIYVTVKVGTDTGNGTLTNSIITYPADKTFNNVYDDTASGSATLTATKKLTGSDLTAGEFTFAVYPDGGTTAVATGTNDASGTVNFSKLTYNRADLAGDTSKVFTYQIKENATVTGMATGFTFDTTVYTAKVTVTDDGSKVLKTSVAYYDADGKQLTAAPTFNNTYKEEYTSRVVTKVWDDNDNLSNTRPAKITVDLMRGNTIIDTQDLTAENNWTYSWDKLAKLDANGNEYEYSIVEEKVSGYTASYTSGINETDNIGYVTIKNTADNLSNPTEKTVYKEWNDDNDSAGDRPSSIMVQLYANGTESGDPVELSADNDWEYTWTGLEPLDSNGDEIEYTTREISVNSNYTATYSDGTFTITNNHSGTIKKNSQNYNSSKPDTGDNSDLEVQLVIAGMAFIGLISLLILRRRRNND